MSAFAPPLHPCTRPANAPSLTRRVSPLTLHPAKRRSTHATMRQSSARKQPPPAPTPSETLPDLKARLLQSLEGLNRGLSINADSPTVGEQEALVEDLIERIEDMNAAEVPTKDPRMFGTWELLYTSSSITRFFGGATGLQRLLPAGEVGRVEQYIDAENGTCEVREELSFEVPIVGTPMKKIAVASGTIRATSQTRQAWDPKEVQFYFFKQFADGWKTLRAFQIADTSFLDESLRITRGQTGSVNVFGKRDDD